jgi:hypothetical protein
MGEYKSSSIQIYTSLSSRLTLNCRSVLNVIWRIPTIKNCLLLLLFMRIVPPLFLVENPHQGGLGLAFWEFLDIIVIGPVFKEPENGQY